MTNIKFRKKAFEKIAQVSAPITPPAPATVIPVTDWIASSAYPTHTAFNATTVLLINQMCSLLNTAVHYATGGKYNFQKLKDLNFKLDTSGMPSPDQKNLINISKMMYDKFLIKNSPLKSDQIAMNVDSILNSQELTALSSTNPSGPIAQKIPGNLRSNISIILNKLKVANPVTTT